MEGVRIRIVPSAKKDDPCGRTWEWAKGVCTLQITVYERKEGVTFGAHFHKGDDPSKNPERFFLAAGEIWAFFEDLNGNCERLVIKPGSEITIAPWILHTMTPLEDVILIEQRVTIFDREHSDTYAEAEFRKLQQAIKI